MSKNTNHRVGSSVYSTAHKHAETGAAIIVSTTENIIARTAENAPANDDLLHGRVRQCRSCGCETDRVDTCTECARAILAERADEQEQLCRIHRVRYVEDLPVSVLEEIRGGRC